MIIYLPDISKSNLPMKLWGDKIVYKYSGDKHAQLIYECITYYVYAYQLRCPKQDVLRTSKLLPKVVICINIIRYTQLVLYNMF